MKTFKIFSVVVTMSLLTGCSGLGLQDSAYDGYFNVMNKMFYNNNSAFGG
jgi:hypothetical protein